MSAAAKNYNPDAKFGIKVWDVDFLKTPKRQLKARVYQPQGTGPFPVLLDLHGGAWNNKDRLANVPMDEAAAKSGILVVAIDMSLAPEAPSSAHARSSRYCFTTGSCSRFSIRWMPRGCARRLTNQPRVARRSPAA